MPSNGFNSPNEHSITFPKKKCFFKYENNSCCKSEMKERKKNVVSVPCATRLEFVYEAKHTGEYK